MGSNDIAEDAFTALDIEGQSNFFTLGFNQPLVLKANREFALEVEFSRQRSETTLLDSPFAISRGADEEGNTNVSALRFSQDYLNREKDRILAVRSQVSLGLDVFIRCDQ